tara:strand:- start:75 stop:560 length:486 start_codon:yes stop_codon:yes gene_type:complete
MESDFVTRQHVESLTPHSDPHLAEVLNNYKFPPPSIPKPAPHQFSGVPMGVYPVMPSNNDMLLGNILGKMEAKLDGNNSSNTLNGISFSLSSELLKWLVLILILAVLIWIVLQFRKPRTNPVNRRLKKLERQLKRMRRKRKKNPKPLELDEDEDEDDDFED